MPQFMYDPDGVLCRYVLVSAVACAFNLLRVLCESCIIFFQVFATV
uniref:Uncharacterized protein n=1 Tax=Anguilla anguilla TaxID=7936 RepID=A0A0E9PLS4_ANGAN